MLFLARVDPNLEFVVQILVLSESLILSESELFFCNQLIGFFQGRGLHTFVYSILPHSRLRDFLDTTFYFQT